MKKLLLLILFLLQILSAQEQIKVLSTVDKEYDPVNMNLSTNMLMPGECFFFWGGVFNVQSNSQYLDSLEVAFAFEHYQDATYMNPDDPDFLNIDIFKANKTDGFLDRFYTYRINLGNEGFPAGFKQDYSNPIPSILKVRSDTTKKIVKLDKGSFFVGIRLEKYRRKFIYNTRTGERYDIPDFGLKIGTVQLSSANKDLKNLSKRYVLFQAPQTFVPRSANLLPAWENNDWAVYMRAFFSDQPPVGTGFTIYDSTKAANPLFTCPGIVSVEALNTNLIEDYNISQNYPNPFNPSTTIKYEVKNNCKVKIDIFNVSGQLVQSLIDSEQDKGIYLIPFDATGLASGIYFYNIQFYEGGIKVYDQNRKMMFTK